jgi:CRISPR/Cas system-associated protein Csm6
MKIITTVGTSIFTNYQNKNKVLRTYSDFRYKDINTIIEDLDNTTSASDYTNSRYLGNIMRVKQVISKLWIAKEKSCAELQTLYKIAEETEEELEVYLLATDTVLSVLACELIKDWLNINSKIIVLEIKIIGGLQVDNSEIFKNEGLKNLVKVISDLNTGNTALNISGGYKAIIPFLTLIGQIEQIPLHYMYEDSNSIITIGKMPFSFDWTLIEKNISYLFDTSLINSQRIEKELIDWGLIDIDKKLTTLGNLAKAYLENENVPYQATTFGYFIEYKLYEYYSKNENKYLNYDKVILGKKLSDEEGKDLEDADLWLENNLGEIIIAEVKSASNSPKSLRKKIKKNLNFVSDRNIKEFWLIIYEYEGDENVNDENWCNKVINNEIQYLFQNIIFKIKKIVIDRNVIDGRRNRMIYHEFLRSSIQNVEQIFSTN